MVTVIPRIQSLGNNWIRLKHFSYLYSNNEARAGVCPVCVRFKSVQSYRRSTLQVRLLKQGDFYDKGRTQPDCHVTLHYPNI